MEYKWIVCVFIVLLSYAAGRLYTWRFTLRLQIFKELKDKFSSMERDVLFSLAYLPDICKEFGEEDNMVGRIFKNTEDIMQNENRPFNTAWRKAVEEEIKGSSLKKETIKSIMSLGKGLGEGDLEEQRKCFSQISMDLKKLINEAEEERMRLKKMYMSLFIFAGIGVAILLI